MIKEGEIPKTYNPSDVPVYCSCGEKIYLNHHLFRLWEDRGIKFKCIKCENWIENRFAPNR
jgi:hypothetical protein